MKTIARTIALAALVVLPLGAYAQTEIAAAVPPTVAPEVSRVATFFANPYAERDANFWNALSSEINLSGPSSDQVTVEELQHIIFFASVHGNRVEFEKSIPVLTKIYRESDSEPRRLMAVAALHAIGTDEAMRPLRTGWYNETSPRVKHVIAAAIVDRPKNR